MPFQNRVTPFAELIATPARGTLMGNRGGRIHDPETRRLTGRRWASRRWICCVLEFRDRHHEVWGAGYTHLFFVDEVTALAAGHRPCMECRRSDAIAFRKAVSRALFLRTTIMCDDLDRRLHAERVDGRQQRRHRADAEGLPDGTMIVDAGGRAFALRGATALAWTPAGYEAPGSRPRGKVTVITPPTSIKAVAAGYRPKWHDSAEMIGAT